MTNDITDVNLRSQIRDRAVVIDTPSLAVPDAEAIPEEIIRDLLIQNWGWTGVTPVPTILIPTDQPRNRTGASVRTQADTISVTNEGEREAYRGHTQELVDSVTAINLHIIVPLRNGRQRLHNLKAGCRSIIYRYAKALSPYHRLYYDGFTPTYEDVNMHVGDVSLRVEAGAIPLFTRRTRGQETPSSDPNLFPRGQQV